MRTYIFNANLFVIRVLRKLSDRLHTAWVIFGILLIYSLGFGVFSELWMQIKTIAVVILTYYHFTLGKYLNDFALDSNQKTSKFFRIYNEIPTLILIVVIFVVIFKPL